MSWLLDRDVLLEAAKPSPDERILAWLQREKDSCQTSAIVIAQLAAWVRTKDQRRRPALLAWLNRLTEAMQGRVLGFTAAVALVWAEQDRLLAALEAPMSLEDSYIAATARRHRLTIVTGREEAFRRPGLSVFNPFTQLPPGYGSPEFEG